MRFYDRLCFGADPNAPPPPADNLGNKSAFQLAFEGPFSNAVFFCMLKFQTEGPPGGVPDDDATAAADEAADEPAADPAAATMSSELRAELDVLAQEIRVTRKEMGRMLIMPVEILQNTFSDRTHCIAQLRPASSFLRSALRFLDRSAIAAPLLWFRMPFWTTPHIWFGASLATLASNAALLGVASHLAADGQGGSGHRIGDGGPAAAAFAVLGALAAVEALGFLLVWANMVPRYCPTLYRRRTTQQHMELVRWDECANKEWGPSKSDARAQMLRFYSNRYWPKKEIVAAWLREHWDDWHADPPRWFTPAWRALFDPRMLPPPSKFSRVLRLQVDDERSK